MAAWALPEVFLGRKTQQKPYQKHHAKHGRGYLKRLFWCHGFLFVVGLVACLPTARWPLEPLNKNFLRGVVSVMKQHLYIKNGWKSPFPSIANWFFRVPGQNLISGFALSFPWQAFSKANLSERGEETGSLDAGHAPASVWMALSQNSAPDFQHFSLHLLGFLPLALRLENTGKVVLAAEGVWMTLSENLAPGFQHFSVHLKGFLPFALLSEDIGKVALAAEGVRVALSENFTAGFQHFSVHLLSFLPLALLSQDIGKVVLAVENARMSLSKNLTAGLQHFSVHLLGFLPIALIFEGKAKLFFCREYLDGCLQELHGWLPALLGTSPRLPATCLAFARYSQDDSLQELHGWLPALLGTSPRLPATCLAFARYSQGCSCCWECLHDSLQELGARLPALLSASPRLPATCLAGWRDWQVRFCWSRCSRDPFQNIPDKSANSSYTSFQLLASSLAFRALLPHLRCFVARLDCFHATSVVLRANFSQNCLCLLPAPIGSEDRGK